MSLRFFVFFFAVATIVAGCDDGGEDGIVLSSYTFDFNEETHGWQHGFSDYPNREYDSSSYELKYAYTAVPPSVGSGKSIMLSGNNHSGDLFMYLKKNIAGLKSNAYYSLTFTVELASNVPGEISKIGGGNHGETVFLKAGASDIEPISVWQNDKFVMNIDKGNQSESGAAMITIGDIATTRSDSTYATISRSSSIYNMPFEVRTNSDGELWIIVGTDSGFKGITTLYYTKISVVVSIRE